MKIDQGIPYHLINVKISNVTYVFINSGSKGPGKYKAHKEESDDHDWGKSKREKLDRMPVHSSSGKPIERIATYGDEYKTLNITQAQGAGGIFQIYIDRYYHGTISKVKNEWVTHLNEPSELTGDDISILVEMIEHDER